MREHASKALKRESPDPTRPRAAPLIPESEELLTPVSSRTCAHERAIPEHFHEPGASVGPCRQPGMAMASHRNRSMPMLALMPRITPVLFHALPAPCASIGAANSGGPDARAVAPASARPATKASKAPVDRALHMLREEQGADRFAHQHGAAMWATSSASPSPTSLLGPRLLLLDRVPKVFGV